MTATTETITVAGEGITLSLLIWRRFQRDMPGLAEATLEANPGLADIGAFLPVGTTFFLPIPAPNDDANRLDTIRLW